MPSEVRYLVFSEEEAITALREYYRKSGQSLPDHAALRLTIAGASPPSGTLVTDATRGRAATKTPVSSEILLAALILYCHGRRIPLPARGSKSLAVLHDRLAVVVALAQPAAKVRAA